MHDTTKAITSYVKDKGITISAVSEKTGIPYDALQASFSKSRKLRADEFLAICSLLDVNPMSFYFDKNTTGKEAG